MKGNLNRTLSNQSPLISIVTVVYNGEAFIEETIKSVISQSYKNYEYIVIDGGSSDSTVEIIKRYQEYIDYWVSEPDNGMYDALNKGLSKARGKYLTWLNADDLFYPGTLETVAIEMEKNKLDWVTGVSSIINADGRIVASGHPVHYFQSLIKKGWYRGDVAGFIQQEGTFFSKELYNKSPLRTDLEFAGDYALWCGFAEISELKTIKATLAMFRIHDAQKSQDIRAYFQECETLKNPRFRFLGKLIKVIGILSDAKLIKPL